MNIPRSAVALTMLVLALSVQVYSEQNNSAETTVSPQSFLGRWDLTLKTPSREYPSWLQITQEKGQLKALLVSGGDTRGRCRKSSSHMGK